MARLQLTLVLEAALAPQSMRHIPLDCRVSLHDLQEHEEIIYASASYF